MGDGGGILIYYGRDWLMLMSLVLVIIERGKKKNRAMEVDQDSGTDIQPAALGLSSRFCLFFFKSSSSKFFLAWLHSSSMKANHSLWNFQANL